MAHRIGILAISRPVRHFQDGQRFDIQALNHKVLKKWPQQMLLQRECNKKKGIVDVSRIEPAMCGYADDLDHYK